MGVPDYITEIQSWQQYSRAQFLKVYLDDYYVRNIATLIMPYKYLTIFDCTPKLIANNKIEFSPGYLYFDGAFIKVNDSFTVQYYTRDELRQKTVNFFYIYTNARFWLRILINSRQIPEKQYVKLDSIVIRNDLVPFVYKWDQLKSMIKVLKGDEFVEFKDDGLYVYSGNENVILEIKFDILKAPQWFFGITELGLKYSSIFPAPFIGLSYSYNYFQWIRYLNPGFEIKLSTNFDDGSLYSYYKPYLNLNLLECFYNGPLDTMQSIVAYRKPMFDYMTNIYKIYARPYTILDIYRDLQEDTFDKMILATLIWYPNIKWRIYYYQPHLPRFLMHILYPPGNMLDEEVYKVFKKSITKRIVTNVGTLSLLNYDMDYLKAYFEDEPKILKPGMIITKTLTIDKCREVAIVPVCSFKYILIVGNQYNHDIIFFRNVEVPTQVNITLIPLESGHFYGFSVIYNRDRIIPIEAVHMNYTAPFGSTNNPKIHGVDIK